MPAPLALYWHRYGGNVQCSQRVIKFSSLTRAPAANRKEVECLRCSRLGTLKALPNSILRGRDVTIFAMTSCRFWRPIRVLVTFLLIFYFVRKIIDSSRKLQNGEIGVSLERIREELVEESSLLFQFPWPYRGIQGYCNKLHIPFLLAGWTNPEALWMGERGHWWICF